MSRNSGCEVVGEKKLVRNRGWVSEGVKGGGERVREKEGEARGDVIVAVIV